jgi:hypothetical protein
LWITFYRGRGLRRSGPSPCGKLGKFFRKKSNYPLDKRLFLWYSSKAVENFWKFSNGFKKVVDKPMLLWYSDQHPPKAACTL